MSEVIINQTLNDGPYPVTRAFTLVAEEGRKIPVEGKETWGCIVGRRPASRLAMARTRKAVARGI